MPTLGVRHGHKYPTRNQITNKCFFLNYAQLHWSSFFTEWTGTFLKFFSSMLLLSIFSLTCHITLPLKLIAFHWRAFYCIEKAPMQELAIMASVVESFTYHLLHFLFRWGQIGNDQGNTLGQTKRCRRRPWLADVKAAVASVRVPRPHGCIAPSLWCNVYVTKKVKGKWAREMPALFAYLSTNNAVLFFEQKPRELRNVS